MTDTYKGHATSTRDPIEAAEVVTPNDSNDLSVFSRAIYVGSDGDLRVTLLSGDDVTFINAQAGWHPIRVARVWATGTTATDILSCS